MNLETRGYTVRSEGKNSPLRVHTAKHIYNFASMYHEKFPKVTPNEVSAAGAIAVMIGGYLIENENRKKDRSKIIVSVGVMLQTVGYFCDALDGALSRVIEAETGVVHYKWTYCRFGNG